MNDVQSRIEVLRPKAGDTIVVHVDARWLTRDQHNAIKQHCERVLPAAVNVMVLDSHFALAHIVAPEVQQPKAEPIHFDAWTRDRTERAHREFMKRTSHLPRCDGCESLAEKLARYFGVREY